MLVEGMSESEINTAIYKDLNILLESSTQPRIERLYIERRKKMKIDKGENYPVFTAIKTKSKNHWLLMTEKDHEFAYVKSGREISTLYLTYYHTYKGIRVFLPCPENNLLVYNGHLFTRYRERMNLATDDPMVIIKQFFSNNCSGLKKMFDQNENGDTPFMSIEKDGYLMGDLQVFSGNISWHVHKTFIPNGTANFKHLDPTNELRLYAAKELLELKLGLVNDIDSHAKECCHLFGFLDKEISIDFLEHLITDMES